MEYYAYSGMTRVDLGNWVPHIPKRNERLSYRDFERTNNKGNPKDLWILPELLSGSDYSNGDVVTLSNHHVFLEEHGKWTGIHDVYGGHGTYAVAIRSDVLTRHPEVQDTLDELEQYPVIDEDHLSQLEIKLQDEAWNNYVQNDLIRKIQKSDPRLENVDPETLNWTHLCGIAMQETNTEWISESTSPYLDLDRITPNVSEMALVQTLTPKQLIMEIGREWISEYAQSKYEARIKT